MNVDYVPSVIELMASRNAEKPGLQWKTMDLGSLEFADASFDIVLDKGTMDSILCGENSTANANKALTEVSRVLKPGGCYIVISYGAPETRMSYLSKAEFKWEVSAQAIRT